MTEEEERNLKKTEINVKYSYEWNEDVSEEERDNMAHTSRPFCKKFIELNKLYTRAAIERLVNA